MENIKEESGIIIILILVEVYLHLLTIHTLEYLFIRHTAIFKRRYKNLLF